MAGMAPGASVSSSGKLQLTLFCAANTSKVQRKKPSQFPMERFLLPSAELMYSRLCTTIPRLATIAIGALTSSLMFEQHPHFQRCASQEGQRRFEDGTIRHEYLGQVFTDPPFFDITKVLWARVPFVTMQACGHDVL